MSCNDVNVRCAWLNVPLIFSQHPSFGFWSGLEWITDHLNPDLQIAKFFAATKKLGVSLNLLVFFRNFAIRLLSLR